MPPLSEPPQLRRSIGMLALALYGIGVTVGAGIYVLVGETARVAGPAAPLSFVLAALLIAPTAFSFAELASRYPRSAGEAVYVHEAFGSLNLARLIGLLVAGAGIVASAAVAVGAAGYMREFVDLPRSLVALALVVLLGLVAAWGVVQAVTLAVVITLIEVGALIWIVAVGLPAIADPLTHLAAIWPAAGADRWLGVGSGLLLAFFAFIGFEDMVNMAEEVERPERALPGAIALTLAATAALYVLVAGVAVALVPPADLAAAEAPLALVLSRAGSGGAAYLSAIAIGSTLNTMLIQIVMASRVLYGLARERALPVWLGVVSPATRTPLAATGLVVALVCLFALFLPIFTLARLTSVVILAVFLCVNMALVVIKRRERAVSAVQRATGHFAVPFWVPLCGAGLSLLVLVFEAVRPAL